MSPLLPPQQASQQQRASQQRAVAFWHAWSALMIAPVLLVLLLTGAVYLFDREFDSRWYQQAYQTIRADGQQMHSLKRQQDFLRQQFGPVQLQRVILPRDNKQAVRWQLRTSQGDVLVYLDPYQLRVNATENPATAPMAIVRRLHGELLAGPAGAYLIEWMSCWTLFLLLTGGWLWWPRRPDGRWRGLAGVLLPRTRPDGRVHWRDWHAIPALFASLALAFLVLTGLPWSVFWGQQFAQLSARLAPLVPAMTPSPNFHLPLTQHNAMAAVASLSGADSHAEHQQGATAPPVTDGTDNWSDALVTAPKGVARAQQLADIGRVEPWLSRLPLAEFGPGVRLLYPATGHDVFKISYVPDQAQGQRTLYIDPATGQLLAEFGWPHYSAAARLVEWGVMVHLGRQYGVLNQWLNLLCCVLAMFALCAGIRLWWQRRRAGYWLPRRQTTDRLPFALQLIFAAMVLLLPLLLLTVLASWLLQLPRARAVPASATPR